MNVRPLLFDETIRAEVQKVIAYAEAHRISLRDIMDIMAHPERAPGNDPKYGMNIPVGFKVVFTIEQQKRGWYRHISISVDEREKAPNVFAVNFILKEFGFWGRIADADMKEKHVPREMHVWLEDCGSGCKAVNVLEKVSAS